ncbi:Mov34/MPN/PAD-1 family protein [soil metagenome]
MDIIAIPDDVRRDMYAHAQAMYPAECCGYLTGPTRGRVVDAAVSCRNAQNVGEHPITPDRTEETGFVIGGSELFNFARSFDSDQPARVVYHSHTNGRAYFSDTDRAMAVGPAYPVQHVVIGVTPDGITEVAQYAWSGDDRDFVEVARWTP